MVTAVKGNGAGSLTGPIPGGDGGDYGGGSGSGSNGGDNGDDSKDRPQHNPDGIAILFGLLAAAAGLYAMYHLVAVVYSKRSDQPDPVSSSASR